MHSQIIIAGLASLERAAADLMRYRLRQWADVQMCRMCIAWLLNRLNG